MTVFRKGDRVRATYEGRSVVALVTLASENGRSLVIDWMSTDDGMLGGHVGVMPVFQGDDGIYRSLFEGVEVSMERTQ